MQVETGMKVTSIWFIDLILGLLILIFLNYLAKRVIRKARKRFPQIRNGWHEKLDTIFFVPIHVLLWVLAGILVFEIGCREFSISLFAGYLNPLRGTAIVLCFGWILLRWTRALHHSRITSLADASFVHLWGRIVTVVIVIITGMILLQMWGLNIGPLIAFGGIGAAAVGFASKDVISNFCGGLMLSITRPFIPGDYIQIASMNLEGHIEEIGWYLTSVRDKDKRAVYLPNSIFSSALVINSSRMTHRRIHEKIGIRYEDFQKIEPLADKLKHALKNHRKIDPSLPILVSLAAFGPYSLDVEVDVYTLATQLPLYFEARQEILLTLYQIIRNEDLYLAGPSLEVIETTR